MACKGTKAAGSVADQTGKVKIGKATRGKGNLDRSRRGGSPRGGSDRERTNLGPPLNKNEKGRGEFTRTGTTGVIGSVQYLKRLRGTIHY